MTERFPSAILLALADLCEGAERLGWQGVTTLNNAIHEIAPEPKVIQPPQYTHSLDAAVALLPDDMCWQVKDNRRVLHLDPEARVWSPLNDGGGKGFSYAPTPALALCAAFLRASCDTHPKDGDVQQAPLVSGAVGEAETPK